MLITNFHMSGSNTSASSSALSLSAAAAVDVDANGGGGKFMNSFLHLQTSSPASASSSLHRGLRCAYAWRSQTAFVLLVLRKSLSSLSTRKSSNALWRRPSNSTRIRLFSSSSSAGSADEAAVHVGRKFGLRDPRFAEAERAKERRNGKGFEVIEAMPVNSQLNGAPFDAEVGSNGNTAEERLDELRHLLGKAPDDVLRIAGVGAGAWGSVFAALLQDAYGAFRDKFQVRIWRRPGRAVDRATAEHLFEVINSREDVLRRLIRRCAYLKYVEARLGDRVLYADEILKDGFCLNMIDNPLCPLKVVTNLQEAVWDADIVINGLPSTETKEVFQEISRYWKERRTAPIIISLAKGVEAALHPFPHIITPTQIIARATGVPSENVLYLGGPNIASEIYNKEYANARICGSDKWRKALAKFLRQPHFIVWDNNDLVTHEVMGGLKNVYAIGAGMVAALTNESATSKSVYFAHCTSEMIFITHLLSEAPEKLAGPLLADTYVTLLKGRNAWYGQMLAKGELSPDMGDSIKGKGMIQGVSAVSAFYELLSQSSLSLLHPDRNKPVAPVELCPILKTLYSILIKRDSSTHAILQALRDETMHDPRERIEIAQSRVFYNPKLLGQVQTPPETP